MRDAELPADACYCGRRGCIEQFLSGPALSRDHGRLGGDESSAAEIAARALAGDARAETALAAYEERMARALGSVINVLDPDVIVLGGGLSNIERLYANVPALWAAYVFSDRVDTRLVRAKHGDASGVRGAAWLWSE
jgi:fructokinase